MLTIQSKIKQSMFNFQATYKYFQCKMYGDNIKTYIHVDITRPPQLPAQTQLPIDDNIVLICSPYKYSD